MILSSMHATAIRKNWLSQDPNPQAFPLALGLSALLFVATWIFLRDELHAQSWMPASGAQVFESKQWFRAWTALFAHADFTHLLSNLVLFLPFAYVLSGYFGRFFFPVLGFAFGGLTNLIVLKTMPAQASIVGVSGVVYWMGAAWVTLAFFIDRREPVWKRALKAVGVSMLLFLPQNYRPEVSYLAHAVGYAFGILAGAAFYFARRSDFIAAESVRYVPHFDWVGEEWQKGWIERSSFQPFFSQSLIWRSLLRGERLPARARLGVRHVDRCRNVDLCGSNV